MRDELRGIIERRHMPKNNNAMRGVTWPTFRCAGCEQTKPIGGRRLMVSGDQSSGYLCADCAPLPEVVAPKPSAPARKSKPAKPLGQGRPNTLMTDEQVLECRAAHEFDGVPPRELCKRYGMDAKYMSKLLDYTVRSRLVPKRGKVA